jgi:cell division protein FtsB
MLRRYWPTALLLALLLLQSQLWLGRGALPDVWQLRDALADLAQDNRNAQLANQALANEVRDLQTGLDSIEAQARMNLGLIKPNEVFVQYPR